MKRHTKYVTVSMLGLSLFMTGCTTGIVKADAGEQAVSEAEDMVVQGVIEAKEVSLNSKIPGRIGAIHVEEGTEVEGGDVIVEIDSKELQAKKEQALALIHAAQASYDAAKGQASAAQAMLSKAQNGARDQEIAQAQAYYDLMLKTYERVESLFEKGAVSAQKKDEVETQLEVANQQLSMAKEGARSEDLRAAQALVTQALAMEQAAKSKLDQAQGGLQEVEAYLKDTKITSPINGSMTVINAEEGELVSSGMSIGTVTDLKHTWVEVKIYETDLDKISLGQEVDVKVPAYGDKVLKGKITRINNKPDYATKRATNDKGSFDIVAFGVKVEIDNQDMHLRPGMTAFVQVSN